MVELSESALYVQLEIALVWFAQLRGPFMRWPLIFEAGQHSQKPFP